MEDQSRKRSLLAKLRAFVKKAGLDPALVKGWTVDVSKQTVFVAPLTEKRFRTRPQVVSYLEDQLNEKQKRGRKRMSNDSDSTESTSSNNEVSNARKRRKSDHLPVKSARHVRWEKLVDAAEPDIRPLLEEYREQGYFILKEVFPPSLIIDLLDGWDVGSEESREGRRAYRHGRRAQLVRDIWPGARAVIRLNREAGGGSCAIRAKGRFDYQLPPCIIPKIEQVLEGKGVLKILRSICPKAKIRTKNVMLSAPGAEQQRMHTDSSWDGSAHRDPLPNYVTVLIPLTKQDEVTGGTRVWPKSHRDYNMKITSESAYVDVIEPTISVGDALVFDGLLSHLGMENKSKDRERYFFYMAFSTKHDPNTDSTM